MKKTVTYKNPFKKDSEGEPSQETIQSAKIVHMIDDGTYIVNPFYRCYNYVVNGCLITQRCGESKVLLEKLLETNCQAGDYDLQYKIRLEMKETR